MQKILLAMVILIFMGMLTAFLLMHNNSTTSVLTQPPITSIPFVTSANASAVLSPSATVSPSHTEQSKIIIYGAYILNNNTWGAPPDEILTSGVYLNDDGTFGWYWNRQDPKTKADVNGILPIYPSLRIGGNPWEQSKLAHFPIQLNAIKSLSFVVDYVYPEAPKGTYDLAYDLFFLDTDKSSEHPEIKTEVMIWLQGTIAQNPQTYKGEFTDGYNTYGLYSYVMSDGRLYDAFIMKGPPVFQAQYTINVKALLDKLDLNPSWYLPGVELGNEVLNGSGKNAISKFAVDLNGSTIER